MNSVIRNFIAKGLFKKKGVIANKKSVDFSANALEQRLKNAGVNPNDIKSENELKQILSFVKQAEDAAFDQRYRVIAGNTPEGRKITDKLFGRQGEVVDMAGKKIDTSQGIMGGKSVKELMDSGQVTKGTQGIKKSKKVQDREMFEGANQRLRGPVKGKMDMGKFGKVDVETDYSAAINRKEFFDSKAKNMYDKTVKTGPEFFKAQKEQILNTINRKKKEMVPTTHSNYKLLKKSLQDQEDALEAIKVTEDLGGNENMFDFLRTQNIADYKSKPLQRSNYVRNETEQEIADRLNKQNKDSLQNLKNKLDDPEDMADGGRIGFRSGKKVYDYNSFEHKINELNAHYKRYKKQGGTIPFEIFSEAFAKENFADGGVAGLLGERTGFANGTKNKKIIKREEDMGPPYETNDPDEALKEIVRRMINVEPAKIPLLKDMVLMFDLDRAQIGGQKNIGGGELSFGINKGFGRDDTGIGFNFKKSFAQGGPARQNFKMGKRAFLKLMGGVGAGIASLKSGLLGFGKKSTVKSVIAPATQAANEAAVPPYFLNLVKKIKNMGDETLATTDKANAYKYKNYTMEEDFAGNIEIMKKGDDVAEDVFMSYKVDDVPVKGKKGSTKVKDYEEFTGKRDYKGDLDVEPGVPDEVVQEGTVFEDDFTNFGKADGGIARMLGE